MKIPKQLHKQWIRRSLCCHNIYKTNVAYILYMLNTGEKKKETVLTE